MLDTSRQLQEAAVQEKSDRKSLSRRKSPTVFNDDRCPETKVTKVDKSQVAISDCSEYAAPHLTASDESLSVRRRLFMDQSPNTSFREQLMASDNESPMVCSDDDCVEIEAKMPDVSLPIKRQTLQSQGNHKKSTVAITKSRHMFYC